MTPVEDTVTIHSLSDGALGPFPTGWHFEDSAEVTVWLRLATDDAWEQLDGSSFTVTGAETLTNGGEVELAGDLVPDGGWAEGAAVGLVRSTPKDQPADLAFAEGFTPEAVTAMFDRQARQLKEVADDAARAFKPPLGTDPTPLPAYDQMVTDAAGAVSAEALAQVAAAGAEQTALATAAIAGQRATALTDIQAAGAEVADGLGIAGGTLIDIIPASSGFDEGWYVTDPNGWTVAANFRGNSGTVGEAVRQKVPGANWSGLPSAFRVYAQPQWYLTPTAVLSAAGAFADSGKYMANESSLTPPSENLFALTTGDIRNTTSGVTITKQAALGPTGLTPNSAVQGVHTTSSAFRFLFDVIPADTWDLTIKVKGTAVGTTNVRRGAASALTSDTVTDGAWKGLPRDPAGIVSDGVTAIDYQVRGDGTNTPTLLYDQLQGYPFGDTPTWADEMADTPFNWHFKKRLSHSGAITFNGDNEIILTGGVNFGYLQAPSFPAATLIDDLCVHIMVDITDGVVNGRIFCTEVASDLTPTTNTSTLYIGTNDTDGTLLTGPVNTGASGANIRLKDAGPTIITLVARDGFRGIFVNGQPVNVVNTGHTEFYARLFQLFGNSAGSLAPSGAFIDSAMRLGQAPTTDDIVSDVQKLIDRNAARWAEGGTRNHFVYNHDSNSAAGFPAGTRGPSSFYTQGNLGLLSRPLFVTNRALSGSSLVRMKRRWDQAGLDVEGIAPTWVHSDKDLVRAARACGVNLIYGIGASFANDQARFGTANVGQLIADTKAFAAEIRLETGNPAVILGAIGNNLASADQLAGRDTYEAAMVADSDLDGDYVYVSLAGTTLWTWNSTDFEDDIHLRGNSSGNGHDKADPLVTAVLDDLVVA
jgi:hypothetical protein